MQIMVEIVRRREKFGSRYHAGCACHEKVIGIIFFFNNVKVDGFVHLSFFARFMVGPM
jgi:hypothetical protein